MDFRLPLLELLDRNVGRIIEPRARVAGSEVGPDESQGGRVTPGATGKGRIALRAGLLLALLGLWGPEAGAQSIGEVVLSPERLQEGDVEQDGNPDPEQEIEVRFTLGSRPAPFTPAAIVANTIRESGSGRASEEDFEAHRLVRTPGVVFLLSERNCGQEDGAWAAAPWECVRSFRIRVTDDSRDEGEERLYIEVGITDDSARYFQSQPTRAELTLVDNDPASPPEPNQEPTGSVVIAGNAAVGEELRADASTLEDGDGLGRLRYRWRRGGADIDGATGATYRVAAADAGALLTVRVSWIDADGEAESVTSSRWRCPIGGTAW